MTNLEWLQFVCAGIAGTFGLVCLFEGTRRAASGASAGRLAAGGIAIVGLLAGYAYWQHTMYLEYAASYQPAGQARELPGDWGKKLSPARKEAASQAYARGAFVSSGKLRQYFDISGQRKVYAPGEEDLKQRERVLAAAARLEHRAQDFFVESILWLVLGLSALLFGLGFALAPAPKTPQAEADAEGAAPIAPPAPAAKPAAPAAKSPVGVDTVPLPKPGVGSDTIPLPKPAVPPGVPPDKR